MFDRALKDLLVAALATPVGGIALAAILRRRGLTWTWALPGLLLALLVGAHSPLVALSLVGISLLACVVGAVWHHDDLHHGADLADAARSRIGMLRMLRRRLANARLARDGWVNSEWLVVGRDRQGMPVSIPVGFESGSHTLVVGATGAGKTVTQAWIAARLVEHGHGAVVIDPKGDQRLRQDLQRAAKGRGARFLEWTPDGPLAYNPYAQGSDTEIADKALSGEQFTEPHYLRQAQRYLGHAVRVMRAANMPVTPVSLMRHLDPLELEVTLRALPEQQAAETQAYLDSLTDRQKRDLAGVRDRLSILAESDTRRRLDPQDSATQLDIHQAVAERAVVYFRLDSDRRPLMAGMLAAAIVSDLVTLVARRQRNPVATVVLIDEFSAVAAEQVSRLFGRSRSAGISLILGTQELADLKSAGQALREQTLGNIATVIAHRQNVPDSAELIAAMAGTMPVWITTQQTEEGLIGRAPASKGNRRRGYEYEIHPSAIKQLATGQAAVITPGWRQRPTIAAICHPHEARR